MDKLSNHGDFDIKISGNVICATLSGSWNSQAAEEFSREFMLLAAHFQDENWGHLVLLDDWELGIPEMVPIIERLVAWCLENGLTRAAQVYSPSMIKQYHLNEMVVQEIGAFQRHSFAKRVDAEEWLAASGFHLDAPYP
jgi:hypothetical protein